jgi:hypothetical protein
MLLALWWHGALGGWDELVAVVIGILIVAALALYGHWQDRRRPLSAPGGTVSAEEPAPSGEASAPTVLPD